MRTFDLPLLEWYQGTLQPAGGTARILSSARLRSRLQRPRFSDAAGSRARSHGRRRSVLLARRIAFGLTLACALALLVGCNDYNPYLGASPIVSSSITSISPSGANAGMNHDILLTVDGSGFAAGSSVTWNSSNSMSVNLVSNVVSPAQIQANIPASFLTTPGTFFVGVIAPGPTSGNNAGNNISNFMPFIVCASSGCPADAPGVSARISARARADSVSPPSATIQIALSYQAFVANSADGSVETATGIARIFLR